MSTFFQDLRYALRQLGKNPGFALVAILTLALGIGANTAVFSAVDAVLLKPLPYAHPSRLMYVRELSAQSTPPRPTRFSYPDFFDWRAANHSFSHLVCYRSNDFTLGGGGRQRHVTGEIVSWDLFQMLGETPRLGRGFLKSEEAPGKLAVVLSDQLWRSQFGANPNIVGTTIELDRQLARVVGVTAPDFRFPVENPKIGLWTTLAIDAATSEGQPMTRQRGAHFIQVVGRLEPGVTMAQATSELNAIEKGISARYPNYRMAGATMEPELTHVVGNVRPVLLMLLGAVGLLLLIACVNIANLLLARATSREREMAVRAAMGATRGRLVWQLLSESLLLGALGSAAGVVLGTYGLRVLVQLGGRDVPRLVTAGMNGDVFAFACGLALATAVLFGLMPAMRVSRVDLNESLKEGARGSTGERDRLRSLLIVAEVAFGLVLMTGAGLLTASFLHLDRTSPGFAPDHLLTFSYDLPDSQYSAAASGRFAAELLQRVRSLPGVTAAAGALPLPMSNDHFTISFNIAERPAAPACEPEAPMEVVTEGYFHTMRIPVIEGRAFDAGDTATSTPVVVVNQTFARRFFPGEDVIGKQIEPGASAGDGRDSMHTIVGVVADTRTGVLQQKSQPMYYMAYPQLAWNSLMVVARTAVPPMTLGRAIRAQVAALDPQVAAYGMTTVNDLMSAALGRPRNEMVLLGGFALVALLLTLVGLYGVMSWMVTRRTREIGVRMALGAQRGAVLGMVLKEALLLLVTGVAVGVAGSLVAARLISSLLYGVRARNPLVLAGACGLLFAAGLLAAWIPALRAASIDPLEALRTE